jgi:hypothetical protein
VSLESSASAGGVVLCPSNLRRPQAAFIRFPNA